MTLRIPDPAHRQDLSVFVERALRIDGSAVIRLRTRADGLVGAWVLTGFGVLAGRVLAGRLDAADLTCAAETLRDGLRRMSGPDIDPGIRMDSQWRGALPPVSGFAHLDNVPVAVVADLARAHAGDAGLLDQDVLRVSAGGIGVGVPVRCVLALTAMGFLPEPAPAGEVVRVRVLPGWLRIDARFGSVFRRRGDPALLL